MTEELKILDFRMQAIRASWCHTPLVEMWIGLWHSISETQLEIMAAQRVLSVVLDQGTQAGKVQVSRQKIVRASLLCADANTTVLDPPAAPKTQERERTRSHSHNVKSQIGRNPINVTRRTGCSLGHIYHWIGPRRCRLFSPSRRSTRRSAARPFAFRLSSDHETTARCSAGPGTGWTWTWTWTWWTWTYTCVVYFTNVSIDLGFQDCVILLLPPS